MTETKDLPAAAILPRVLFDTHDDCKLPVENNVAACPILLVPTELLIEIFLCIYSECHQKSSHVLEERSPDFGSELPTYGVPFDPYSPSLFPYNVASVCGRWRSILCSPSFPTFWTRLVFIVGITAPEAIHEILSWSGTLPLELSVIQIDSLCPVGANRPWYVELDDVNDVTRSILPQIKRFTTIKYSLTRSSSLVMARMALVGKARMLQALHMTYEEDDGDGGYEGQLWVPEQLEGRSPPFHGWKLITHNIEHLNVDNYTFKPACYLKSDGFHDLLRLRSLTLSWPHPRRHEEELAASRRGRILFDNFMEVLQEAPMLTSLTVRNEQFDGMEPEKDFEVEYGLPCLRFVNFDGVSMRFVTRFHCSANIDLENLVIVHLSISDSWVVTS